MFKFSAQKLSKLRDTQAIMMSPLSFPTDREWCLAVLRSFKDLLDVDIAHIALAHGPTPLLLTEDFDPRLFDVLGIIGSREGIMEFSDDHVNATQRRAADTHLKVYDTRQVLEEATGRRLEDTQLYQEFIEPLGAVDPITIQVGLPGGTALVAVGHRRKDRAMTPETEEWYLAQLLASALEAGANVLVRMERQRSSLQSILDQLGMAVFAYDPSGREIGRSNAAIQLLCRDTDPAFPAMLDRALKEAISIHSNGSGAAFRPSGVSRICTMQRQYLVRSSWVEAGILARDPVALIVVDSLTVELPSKQQLTSRFGLTAREAEISLLLARGASNAAIARTLHISPSTVRTHAERIFPKLGVRSRKALGLLLLQSL